MMTILLERQEYLRATHLPRQTCSLAIYGSRIEICERVLQQYTSVDSTIVKAPIRLRGSLGQNLAAGTRSCERSWVNGLKLGLYQAQF